MNFHVINGPNMNLLGVREKAYYGGKTLSDVEEEVKRCADELGVKVNFFQSNHEGEIVDYIQKHLHEINGAILNPAGLSKTGYCILDALTSVSIPYIEVHLSNIFARGSWHAESIFSVDSVGQIIGFKEDVYPLALRALTLHLQKRIFEETIV